MSTTANQALRATANGYVIEYATTKYITLPSCEFVLTILLTLCVYCYCSAIICPGHSRPVPDVQFGCMNESENGSYLLVSSCLDNKSMVRDGISGDWIGTFIGHKGAVWCTRINATSTLAATGSADFSVKLWDASNGDTLYTFPHKHIVKAVEFSRDSSKLYTGGHEKLVRVYDLTTFSDTPILCSKPQSTSINTIVQLPNPTQIAVSGTDNNITIYNTVDLSMANTIHTDHPVTSLTIANDRSLICVSYGSQISLYNSTTFYHVHTIKLDHIISCAAYDPLLQRFISGSSTELWVRCYDYNGNELSIGKGHHGPVRSLAFAPHSMTYCSGSEDGTIRIWSSDYKSQAEPIDAIKQSMQQTHINHTAHNAVNKDSTISVTS